MLCETNDAGLFVTAFMGFLDIYTGQFTYVNAGHNPPLIMRADGVCEWMRIKSGFVLAGMENMRYKQYDMTLNQGDKIFMYTDGVTEAVNLQNELFGEDRLLSAANKYKEYNLDDFISCVKSEIDIFSNGAEQADDITMLVLKVKTTNQ